MESAVFLGGICLLLWCIPKLLGFFWPFVASWILALLATPLCNFLERHIKLKKKWASAVIIVLVLLILAGLGYLLVTRIGGELIELLSGTPTYYSQVQQAILDVGDVLEEKITPISGDLGARIPVIFDALLSQMGTAVNRMAPRGVEMMGSAATNITNGFIGTIVMIISAYFFIADREKMTAWLLGAVPEDIRQTACDLKGRIMGALGGFFLAQVKIMCMIFILLLVGLLLLRNPYALLLALLISFVDLLPILGTGTILIPWAVICLFQNDYRQGIGLLVLYVICLAARQVLQPKILADSMGMDSMTTLVLIYAGYKMDGLRGMIIALLAGVVLITLYKFGLFDRKIRRMHALFYAYRHYGEEELGERPRVKKEYEGEEKLR